MSKCTCQFTCHLVYLTTNTYTGKMYIGKHSTDNYDDDYKGSGSQLKADIRWMGEDHFEKRVLATFKTEQEAFDAEEELLGDDWKREDYYNCKRGGGTACDGTRCQNNKNYDITGHRENTMVVVDQYKAKPENSKIIFECDCCGQRKEMWRTEVVRNFNERTKRMRVNDVECPNGCQLGDHAYHHLIKNNDVWENTWMIDCPCEWCWEEGQRDMWIVPDDPDDDLSIEELLAKRKPVIA